MTVIGIAAGATRTDSDLRPIVQLSAEEWKLLIAGTHYPKSECPPRQGDMIDIATRFKALLAVEEAAKLAGETGKRLREYANMIDRAVEAADAACDLAEFRNAKNV